MAQDLANCAEGLPNRVSVVLPLPLPGPFDYAVPDGLILDHGDYVRVPFGRIESFGVVWAAGGQDQVADERLKPVTERLDSPPMPEVSRRFAEWVSRYTLSPLGSVVRMSVSVPAALSPPPPRPGFRLADALPDGLKPTAARRRVLAVLADCLARPLTELAREAGCGTGVIQGLMKAGAIDVVDLPRGPAFAPPQFERPGPTLTPDQAAATEALGSSIDAGGYACTLLDGVTGSGKTEVYLEAVAQVLANGRQALVLLPEIALSPQWLDRFAKRFGTRPVVWHSELTGRQRRAAWRAVATGEARAIVGARSALFLPYPELGLIVVDEEHDAAYKQEDGVPYQARDMAVVRATLGEIPIILASATPSLESSVNADLDRYQRLRLSRRHGGAELPAISAVDLRADPPDRGRFLSPPLLRTVAAALAEGSQAMLFLNRRGYAPLTLCRVCGHRLECPNCTAWLVEHRLTGRLLCHHCGFQSRRPRACPECDAESSFVPCGPGVERIAEEVDLALPGARWRIATSDTLTGASAVESLVADMISGEVNLLIGTQLIAKGHHFPHLTVVGVVDADLGLAGGDLRASERTYQLLHQVAGRAGRAERAGRVLLQTHLPTHPVIEALVEGDRDRFLAEEAAERRLHGLPPFGRLAAVILSGPQPGTVDAAAAALARSVPVRDDLVVLGPAAAPLAVLRGRHRRRFLVKARRNAPIQSSIADWISGTRLPSSIRTTIDIDPYSFL